MTPALTHQVVLVTGANQGLGFHTAKHLSKIAGWTVLLGSRDAKRGQTAVDQIKEEGAVAEVVPVELDITSDTSIEAIRSLIEEKHGRLDALVNNAGTSFDFDQSLSARERFRATFDVNVFGVQVLTDALRPLLEKSDFPRIVNVSSTLGSITKRFEPGNKLAPIPVYNSSKSALNALTAYYALAFPQSRVVSVCPGFNATNLNKYTGTQSPDVGAKIIVRATVEGRDSELKTGQFWNDRNEQLPW